jgi:UPF0755 protein
MRYHFKRPKPSRRLAIAIVSLVIVALASGIALVRKSYFDNLRPLSNSETSQLINIPHGSSVQAIAKTLESQHVIRRAWAFEWYVRGSEYKDQLQAGTYSLKPSQSVKEIVTIMSHGHIATDLVTILPAKRLDELRDGLINSGFEVADVDAALNPELYNGHPALADKPQQASLEGYLYPESFQRTANTKPENIIRLSLDEMQKRLTAEIRAGFTAQGLSVHQGVILASIVEKEVSKAEDRPIVAQVFLRRLREGMELGSDVTAFYGSIVNNQTPSVNYDSPFNTRIHTGLPPGPISNTSKSSLEAVVHPASTDYLYFVSGDDGTTHFSHTLAEHQALTRQYCTKLCN